MNSKLFIFTLLSVLSAQEADNAANDSVKCLQEKNCKVDLNCIQRCFPKVQLKDKSAQAAMDCMQKCPKDDQLAPCVSKCYSSNTEKPKEDKDDSKSDNSTTTTSASDKPKATNTPSTSNALTLASSGFVGLILTLAAMAL